MDNYKLDSPQNLPKFSIFPSLKGHSPKRIFMGDKEKKESNSLAFLEQ